MGQLIVIHDSGPKEDLMKEPRRILQIIPSLSTKMGGDVYACTNIAYKLRELDYSVGILTTDYQIEKQLVRELADKGIEVHAFPYNFSHAGFIYSRGLNSYAAAKLSHYDIIHMHNYRTHQNFMACRHAKRDSTRIVMQPHGSFADYYKDYGGKKVLKTLFDIRYSGTILGGIDGWIAVSREEREQLLDSGICNPIEVIHPGINTDILDDLPIEGEFRKKNGINSELLLYLGRIHRTKGIDFAIQAYSRVVKEFPDSKFLICGADGGELTKLKTMVKNLSVEDHVVFKGFISNSEKFSAMRDSDVFIHTVRYMSGVGVAPIEAILCGSTPIITQECSEAIEHMPCVRIVNFGDVDSLANSIREILKNLLLLKGLNENCRKRIVDEMGYDRVIYKYINFYNKLSGL